MHGVFFISVVVGTAVSVLEQQGYAPERGKTYESVDHAADGRGLSAEYPRNKVKSEQSDASPVNTADDGQYKRDAIYNHGARLLSRLVCSRRRTFIIEIFAFDKTGAF